VFKKFLVALAAIFGAMFLLPLSSYACEQTRLQEVSYPRVDRYLTMRVGEKCVFSYDFEKGYGSASFLNMNTYNVGSSDNLDIKIDDSNPKIYKIIVVAKSAGEGEFHFGETLTQANYRSYQWHIFNTVTILDGPIKGDSKKPSAPAKK